MLVCIAAPHRVHNQLFCDLTYLIRYPLHLVLLNVTISYIRNTLYEQIFRIPDPVHRSNWCIALRDHKLVMQLFWERRIILVIAGSRENTMTAPLPRLVRADTTALVASFLANGGKVTVCKPSRRRAGLSASRNRR